MSAEGVAALLAGIATFIGSVILAVRGLSGDRFQRKVTESTNLLNGYTQQVKDLRNDMTAMREQHAHDLERQATHHRAELENTNYLHEQERHRWQEERDRLEERIDTLEAQVAAVLMQVRQPGRDDR